MDVNRAVRRVHLDGKGKHCAYRHQQYANTKSHGRYLRMISILRRETSKKPYCFVTPWVGEQQKPGRPRPKRDTSAGLLAPSEFHRDRDWLRLPQAGIH